MEYLSGLSKLTATPAQPDPVAQAAADIGDAVEKAVAEELTEEQPATPLEEDSLYQQLRREAQDLSKDQPAAQPPVEEDEEDEDSSPTRRIDFSNLKFGKDYEIE